MHDKSRYLPKRSELLSRLAVFLIGVPLLTAPSALAADPKSGAADFTGTKHLKLTIGEGQLKLETDFHRFDFGGKISLAANGSVKNTSKKKLFGAVYIGFFDKEKNLVGCSSQRITVDPGKQSFVGSVIEIPTDQMNKIASYQVRIYEGEKEIGKK
jgi:hypothetical protein